MSLSEIYDDLDSFEAQQQNIELLKAQHELKDKVERLENELSSLKERISILENENATLARNISRLFMTAKKEIREKEARIVELTKSAPVTVRKVHCGIQTNLCENKSIMQLKIAKNIPNGKTREDRYMRRSRSRDRKSRRSRRRSRSRTRKRKRSKSRSRSDSRKENVKYKKSDLQNFEPEVHVEECLTVDGISLCDKEFVDYCEKMFTEECTDVERQQNIPKSKTCLELESRKEEISKNTPEDFKTAPEKAFEEISKKISDKEVLEEVNGKVLEAVNEKVPEEVNEKVPEEVGEKVPEEVNEKVPEEVNEKVPETMHSNERHYTTDNNQNLIEMNTDLHSEQPLETIARADESPKLDIIPKSNEDHNFLQEINKFEKLPVITTETTNTLYEVNEKIDKIFILMDKLLTNQQQLQQQILENKEILTKTAPEKIRLKFDENSPNNFIFNESKGEVVLLKPTIIKLQPVNESVSENIDDQRKSQECPGTPPRTQNLHNRCMAVVSTPKKKPKIFPLLDKHISAEIKNLMPNRYVNNTISPSTTTISEFKGVSKNEKINILVPRKWKRNVTNTCSKTHTMTNQDPQPFVQNNNLHIFNESAKMFDFCSPEKTITLSQLLSKSPSMQAATALSQTILEEKRVNKDNTTQNIEAIIKSIENENEPHQDFTVNSLYDILTKITKPPQAETDQVQSQPELEEVQIEVSRKLNGDINGDMDCMIADHILMDKEASFSSLLDVMENSKMDVCQYYEEKIRKAEESAVRNFDNILINDKMNMPKVVDCDEESKVDKNVGVIADMPLILNGDDDTINKKGVQEKKNDPIKSKRVTRRSIVAMNPRSLNVNFEVSNDSGNVGNCTNNNRKMKEKANKCIIATNVANVVKDPNMEKLKRIRRLFSTSQSTTTPPPQSSTHALKFLSVFLGLFFVFIGTLKLTAVVSKDLHKDLVREFVKYSKIFPLAQFFGFKIRSKWYRKTTGVLEIFLGAAMALYPSHKIKNTANLGLIFLTLLSVYSHFMVYEKFVRTCGPLVFLIMLLGRLTVYSQMNKRYALAAQKDCTESAESNANGLLKQD